MKSIISLSLLAAMPASAAISISLPGHQETAVWTALDNSQHAPVATTHLPWGPVMADAGSSVSIAKLSGPGYFYSGGIYGWHTAPSVYQLSGVSPVAGLATVVLQARLNQTPTALLLSYNGGNQSIAASMAVTNPAGTGGFGPISDHAWQWDLSGINEKITSFSIDLAVPPSTVIYASAPLRLDFGDTFVQAIPEPSSALAALLGLGLTLTRRRRA